jgi:hypothetical protein
MKIALDKRSENVRGYIDGDSQSGDVDEQVFRAQKEGKSILSGKVVVEERTSTFLRERYGVAA